MIITPIKYQYYKLMYGKRQVEKSLNWEQIMNYQNLPQLQQKFKATNYPKLQSNVLIDSHKTSFNRSIFHILEEYGKPCCLVTKRIGTVLHEVLLYEKNIQSLKTTIIYNFIDHQLATIAFQFTVFNAYQIETIQHYLTAAFVGEKLPKTGQFSIIDSKGNRLEYQHTADLVLTYINNDPAVIQNINSGLFQANFHPERFSFQRDFQISV